MPDPATSKGARAVAIACILAAIAALPVRTGNAQPATDPVPPGWRSLEAQARAAHAGGRWRDAERLFLEAANETMPTAREGGSAGQSGRLLFCAACSAALAGDSPAAFEHLENAVTNGYLDVAWMNTDHDVAALRRDTSRWQAIMDRAEALARAETAAHPSADLLLPEKIPDTGWLDAVVAFHADLGSNEEFAALWRPVVARTGKAAILIQGSRLVGPGRYLWNLDDFSRERTRILAHLAEVLRQHPEIDPGRLTLAGHLQGGAIVYLLGLMEPSRWHGLLPMAGYDPFGGVLDVRLDLSHPILVFAILGREDDDRIVTFNEQIEKASLAGNLSLRVRRFDHVEQALPDGIEGAILEGLAWFDTERGRPAVRPTPSR